MGCNNLYNILTCDVVFSFDRIPTLYEDFLLFV